jgi:hypothetical protein
VPKHSKQSNILEKRGKSISPNRGGKIDKIIRANLRKAGKEKQEELLQRIEREETSLRRKELLE